MIRRTKIIGKKTLSLSLFFNVSLKKTKLKNVDADKDLNRYYACIDFRQNNTRTACIQKTRKIRYVT